MKSETRATTNFNKWVLPYRDYRFWLNLTFILASSLQLVSLQVKAISLDSLDAQLASSVVLRSFGLFLLVAALISAVLFGLPGALSTICITAILLIPKFIQWSPAPYVNVILVRYAVMAALVLTVGYTVSREENAHLKMQDLNRQMKEILAEKERFFKLASEAQENERRRISRDLHDDSLQLLAAVSLQLDAAINADDSIAAHAQMFRAKETITQTSDAIRRYCEALRPLLLDTLGLCPSVELIGRELEKDSGIKFNFETEGEPRLIRDDDRIHVFRVMQEAFHNIEKHSKATAVRVRWIYSEKELEVTVTDNGIGMWNLGPAPARSLGIQGMYERMELVGGRLAIDSQPGFGTKVSLQIALD